MTQPNEFSVLKQNHSGAATKLGLTCVRRCTLIN